MATRKVTESLSDFQTESTRAAVESLKAYWEFWGEVARDPASFASAYSRYYSVNLKSCQAVLDASVALGDRLFGAATGDKAPQAGAEMAQSAPMRELVFEHSEGETPARQFVVANMTPQMIDVSFEVSEFVSVGMEKVRAEVFLAPASFTLLSGEEKIVDCRIPIGASFREGSEYRAVLRAVGLPEMKIALVVRRVAMQHAPELAKADRVAGVKRSRHRRTDSRSAVKGK